MGQEKSLAAEERLKLLFLRSDRNLAGGMGRLQEQADMTVYVLLVARLLGVAHTGTATRALESDLASWVSQSSSSVSEVYTALAAQG